MPWVKLWAKGRCPSGNSQEMSSYQWSDGDDSDESLKSDAEDFGESTYLRDASRGFTYGFERLAKLPDEARERLIQEYESRRAGLEAMLDRLYGEIDQTSPLDRLRVAMRGKTLQVNLDGLARIQTTIAEEIAELEAKKKP